MWNLKSVHKFISALNGLELSRWLLAVCCLLLAFFYPGHNQLQTIVIHPGRVISYKLPPIVSSLYPLSDGTILPHVSARSLVIQDVVSRAILYSKSPDTLMLPASTTKIMTALVALDYWADLDTVITVQNEDHAIGSTMDLVRGESITVRSLLYGLLLPSGNDAALALADNYAGGYSAFVSAMNSKAKALHLDHTTYKNPSGVEEYGHLTTARDLAILASVAIQNQTLATIVSTPTTIVTDTTGTISHYLRTTDELLGQIEGLKGLKTGWTENAGECLVSYLDRDGRRVVIVVLGSLDRFGDTRRLVDWVYLHHSWIVPEL